MRGRSVLGLGIGLIISGGVLCFGAYVAGADTSVTWNNVKIGVNGVTYVSRDYDSEEFNTITEKLENFDKLTLNIDTMDLEIKTGDTYQLEATYAKAGVFSYEVKKDELVIKQSAKHPSLFGFNTKIGKMTLYIPEGKSLEHMDIEMGIGEAHIDNVVTDAFELKGGVGEVVINNLVSQDTDTKMGIGDVKIQGDLKGKTSIEGGVGSFYLELVGDEKEYNYTINKGIGETIINNRTYEGFGDTKENNDAPNQITIDSGIGEIKIKTN